MRHPHRHLDLRIYSAFALALLVIITVGVRTWLGVLAFERSGHAVAEGYSALLDLQSFLSATQDAHRSLRGYLLTGRQEFAAPIEQELKQASVELARIKRLIDREQRPAILRLERQFATLDAHIRQQALLEATGRHTEAVSMADRGTGEAAQRNVRTTVQGIVRAMQDRLSHLEADSAGLAGDLKWQVLTGIGVALVLVSGSVVAVAFDIRRRRRAEAERDDVIRALRQALAEVRTLADLLPTCAWCRKVRDDQGYWKKLEAYVTAHTGTRFSHGICPDCEHKMLGEMAGEAFDGIEDG